MLTQVKKLLPWGKLNNARPDVFKNKDEEELKNNLIETINNSNILILENNKKILAYVAYQIKEKHNKIM